MLKDFDIEISYSNKGLLPWEGGCLWEIEGEKPLLQLRKIFESQDKFLGIYSKEEIINHELVHAKRIAIKGAIFEEVLAYQTSKSPFRRFFGPIFRSSKESAFFLLSSLTLILSPWIFLSIVAFFLVRLLRVQRIFAKAKKKATAEELILMDDDQIFSLGKKSGTQKF